MCIAGAQYYLLNKYILTLVFFYLKQRCYTNALNWIFLLSLCTLLKNKLKHRVVNGLKKKAVKNKKAVPISITDYGVSLPCQAGGPQRSQHFAQIECRLYHFALHFVAVPEIVSDR